MSDLPTCLKCGQAIQGRYLKVSLEGGAGPGKSLAVCLPCIMASLAPIVGAITKKFGAWFSFGVK